MKRQRSRNRGGGGGGGGGGGNKPTHNVNRAFDSNGPEGVKIRGHAQHVFEKYQQLARDAQGAGDRVLAENHLQHAEHYFRLIRAVTPSRPASDIIGRDAFTSGIDIDFEDESGSQAAAMAAAQSAENEAGEASDGGETGGDQRSDQPRSDQQRSDRGDYQRSDRGDSRSDNRDRYEGGRREYRDNRSEGGQRSDNNRPDNNRPDGNRQDGGQRSDGNRSEGYQRSEQRPAERPDYRGDANRPEGQRSEGPRRDERPRDDRPRDERPRDDRPRSERYSRDRYEPRGERNGADPLAVVEPQATPLVQPAADTPKPSRSSRSRSRGDAPSAPQAEPAASSGRVLRSHDGDTSHLPAFLQQRTEAPAPEAAEAPVAPKRRGRPPRATVTEPAEEA